MKAVDFPVSQQSQSCIKFSNHRRNCIFPRTWMSRKDQMQRRNLHLKTMFSPQTNELGIFHNTGNFFLHFSQSHHPIKSVHDFVFSLRRIGHWHIGMPCLHSGLARYLITEIIRLVFIPHSKGQGQKYLISKRNQHRIFPLLHDIFSQIYSKAKHTIARFIRHKLSSPRPTHSLQYSISCDNPKNKLIDPFLLQQILRNEKEADIFQSLSSHYPKRMLPPGCSFLSLIHYPV